MEGKRDRDRSIHGEIERFRVRFFVFLVVATVRMAMESLGREEGVDEEGEEERREECGFV